MMESSFLLVSLLPLFLFSCLTLTCDGATDADGLCSLFVFTPFTNNGTASASFSSERNGTSNPGFAMMASALLAMEHFNARNSSVVAELSSSSELMQGCNVRFDLNDNRSKAFDTGTMTHQASRLLFQEGRTPCAIAGPFNDIPALELSTMAQAAEYPLVAHRAFNALVESDRFHPFTSLVFPGMVESSSVLIDYLLHKDRTDFISLFYSVSDLNTQRREILGLALDAAGMKWDARSYFYDIGGEPQPQRNPEFQQVRTTTAALRQVRERGYRTIVMFFEDPVWEFQALADAAEELGMNGGDYLWVWFGLFDPAFLFSDNANVTKLLAGVPLLLPLELGTFRDVWQSQDSDFVDRVNAFSPIADEGDVGYVYADGDYFQTTGPEWGAGFMYDAVMSIGLGACLATQQQQPTNSSSAAVTGAAHLAGIRSVNFVGATREIKFYQVGESKGGRVRSTTLWGAFNLLPPPQSGAAAEELVPYTLTDLLDPGSESWTEIAVFVYADGRTVPPDLLRDPPDQNFLNNGIRAFGLALMATVFVAAMATTAWVYLRREHRVLKAAQPVFLYVLAFGSMVSASTILALSFDESMGWSTGALSGACMASTWLMTIGIILIYGALFSKLWRVNKVLQFTRRKINIRQVAWPMAVLVACAVVVLSLWTALDGLDWTRKVINEETGESIGQCSGDHSGAYIGTLVGLMLIPIILTGFMAYKTKDVSDQYSEAKWVWILFVVQLEVFLVAVPTVIVLRDVSTDGRYLGLTFIFWIFPMSTLSLIMVPKISAYRQSISGKEEISSRKRGESVGVCVSGVPEEVSRASAEYSSEMYSGDNEISPLQGEEKENEDAHLTRISEE